MISYKSPDLSAVRPVFSLQTDDSETVIPAINCTRFFASDIEAEIQGESNSTFYRDAYSDRDWVCPDLNQIEIGGLTRSAAGEFSWLRVNFMSCSDAT